MRRIISALALLLASAGALACGFCVEDRVASVYDHKLAQRAAAQRHQLAVFAFESVAAPGKTSSKAIAAAAEAVPGIDKGSARVSLESSALAVSFDPARHSAKDIERALTDKLASAGLRASLLQVPAATSSAKTASVR
jgi:hypothetical protein